MIQIGRPRVIPAFSINVGQWLVGLGSLVLLGLHTFKANVTIDWISFGLLGMVALAAVLPTVIQFTLKVGREGLEASMSRALDHVANLAGGKDVKVEPTPALTEAVRSPLASINLSRQALATALKNLATAAGLSSDVGDLSKLATELQRAGHLTPAEVGAVTRLAATFDEAAKRGDASSAAAVTADLATQVLTATLKQRTADVAKALAEMASTPTPSATPTPPWTPPSPGPPTPTVPKRQK